MEKLVVVIMGQNAERFIGMCLDSVKDADAIVYCDGGSSDNTLHIVNKFEDTRRIAPTIIGNPYDQEDKTMNGKQRNFYLDYIKENYPDYWVLCLDADEIVHDLSKIKRMIQCMQKGVYSVKMRHLIGDLGHEDSITPEHFVANRLFHISTVDKYPEVEHPVLIPKEEFKETYTTTCTTIWHLSYIPGLWKYRDQYKKQLEVSNMHSKEYLKDWYYQHIFGGFPKKQFNILELPKVITDEFLIDRDEIYFQSRGLELKHFIDAIHWKEFFKCKKVIEFGCGRGPRVFALNSIGVITMGLEISNYAIENSLNKEAIKYGDVTNEIIEIDEPLDLVVAYDLLEHIEYNKLETVIDNIVKVTMKNILISVPFKETPNCEADPTHIIKEDRDWWLEQFNNKGLSYIEVPKHFLYRDQLMIFRKEKINE